jgi:AcrR family transcriptional regulator
MFEAMTTLLDQKRQTTADHLVRAAVAGLAKHGFTVTVDDIAREANVSRRTIFRHFATRDELLAVALTQQSDNFRSTLPQLGDQGWPAWLAELCQAVHQANDTLHDIDNYRRSRNSDVADTLWQAIGQAGGAPAELRAVVASHLSPHFTTAVSQDAQGDHSMAASLAQDAILAALEPYSHTVNAGQH